MKKEELIKEAWSKLMPDYTNIDLDNGWSLNDFYEEDFNDVDFNAQQIYTPCKIRPKSLQGIENNNGWIKIESEYDLPKDGHYWVITKEGILTDSPKSNDLFQDNNYWLSNITHYQLIEKPKPPIY